MELRFHLPCVRTCVSCVASLFLLLMSILSFPLSRSLVSAFFPLHARARAYEKRYTWMLAFFVRIPSGRTDGQWCIVAPLNRRSCSDPARYSHRNAGYRKLRFRDGEGGGLRDTRVFHRDASKISRMRAKIDFERISGNCRIVSSKVCSTCFTKERTFPFSSRNSYFRSFHTFLNTGVACRSLFRLYPRTLRKRDRKRR